MRQLLRELLQHQEVFLGKSRSELEGRRLRCCLHRPQGYRKLKISVSVSLSKPFLQLPDNFQGKGSKELYWLITYKDNVVNDYARSWGFLSDAKSFFKCVLTKNNKGTWKPQWELTNVLTDSLFIIKAFPVLHKAVVPIEIVEKIKTIVLFFKPITPNFFNLLEDYPFFLPHFITI